MKFFDILFAEKHGEALSISHFDALFAKYIAPAAEIWAEYDGTLPAQYSANGSMLADYHIYGSTGGVGDVTAQLFDPNATNTNNGYIAGKYLGYNNEILNPTYPFEWAISEYISCSPRTTYVLETIGNNTYPSICWYDDNYTFLSGTQYNLSAKLTVTSPANAAYVRFSIYRWNMSKNSLTLSPAPESYTPYGYAVDMNVMGVNLFDATTVTVGRWISINGTIDNNILGAVSRQIPIIPGKNYIYYYTGLQPYNMRINEYGINGETLRTLNIDETFKIAFTASQNAAYIIAGVAKSSAITQNDVNNYKLEICEGSMPLPYRPYFNTTTPIYIGDNPLGEDEYVDYKAGKIYRTTKNIMPSAAAGSATDHGVTVTCDGNSTYQISGRANGNAVIRFDLREFTIPAALDNGGNGVISVSYPRDPDVTIYLLDGNNAVYTINPYYGNVYTDYGVGLTIDGIAFAIADGQYADESPFIIMITNDGTVPSVSDDYVPHLTPTDPPVPLPTLPTVDGTTTTDYAGESVAPSRFYAKYLKG